MGSATLSPSFWLSVDCLDTAGGAVSSDTEDVDSILSVDWLAAAGGATGQDTGHGDSLRQECFLQQPLLSLMV